MDDNYYRAIIGYSDIICGKRLGNLTPWHIALIDALDLQIVGENARAKPKDILRLIKVVGSSYPNEPDMTQRFSDVIWEKRLGNQKIYNREVSKLIEWLKNQNSTPVFWHDESPAKLKGQLTAPPMAWLVVHLAGKLNISLHDAWNMRISEARWYSAIKADQDGGNIHFSYETDTYQSEIKHMTDADQIKIAREQLPAEAFKDWMKARKKNRR